MSSCRATNAKTTKPRKNDAWSETAEGKWSRDFSTRVLGQILAAGTRFVWVIHCFDRKKGHDEVVADGVAESLTLAKAAVLQSVKKRGLS